mmetsp:Transcript_60148/g.143366  ORF Transcript_60148/g.143366 Transcript_60148/m.143366 type:complete len:98 (-) Transcript_60148:7-300(-)
MVAHPRCLHLHDSLQAAVVPHVKALGVQYQQDMTLGLFHHTFSKSLVLGRSPVPCSTQGHSPGFLSGPLASGRPENPEMQCNDACAAARGRVARMSP